MSHAQFLDMLDHVRACGRIEKKQVGHRYKRGNLGCLCSDAPIDINLETDVQPSTYRHSNRPSCFLERILNMILCPLHIWIIRISFCA